MEERKKRGVDLEDVVLYNGDVSLSLSFFPSISDTCDSDASVLNLFEVKEANANKHHEKRREVAFDIR